MSAPTTPKGRAAEAWARLSLLSRDGPEIARLLRACGDLSPDSAHVLYAHAEAIEVSLPALLTLGCPVPGGFDAMADPVAILEAR